MPDLNEFRVHTIDGVRPGPRLLIIAGVHGDEFEPIAAVERLTRTIDRLQLSGALTLVPVTNESAHARGARCGEDGLDLARTCPGKADGLRTERVAAQLSKLIRSSTHFIDLHTGGIICALVPLTGYMLHPNPEVLDTQRKMARAFGLPYVWGTTPKLDGRSLSVSRDANVPAIYSEHGGGATFNPAAVDDLVHGCLNVARLLKMLPGEVGAAPATAVVEDARSDSGHLQIQNLSPIDGIFETRVKLGDTISAGQEIGSVRSPLTGEQVIVRAANDGIVFMMRLVAGVRKGDALAVVVEQKDYR